ncbi:MAG: YceI family protein [Bacteroidetes bacterium]|nr:YceI family protein [Bacteroidota bacterium]
MATTKWVLDPTHSEVQFKAKHLMITNVTGSFQNISANAETQDDSFSGAKVSFTAETGSVNTNNEQRDGHLKSADFFDSEKFPQLKFESTAFEKKSENEYSLKGNLTIKDVTKPVSLNVEFAGIQKDPYGNTKAGFSVNGKINRAEFGLIWNTVLETGGVLVSEDIKIQGEVQMVKQV